jgi:high-affinity nickel-transport protein
MFAVIAALHVVGFVLLFVVIAPQDLALGDSGVFTVGLGLTAYTLGLRHAFDADHIGAIDNTTRKLMSDGPAPAQRRVLLLARALDDRVPARRARHSASAAGGAVARRARAHQATGSSGDVSGTFLWHRDPQPARAVSIVGIFRRMRRGDYDEAELEDSSTTAAS